MKKAIAYCRKSIKPKSNVTESESIEYQLNSIYDHAKNNDIEVIKAYNDVGYSGKNTNRPELNEILQDLKSGKVEVDGLLMYSTDRFGRDLEHNVNTMKEILEYVDSVSLVAENLSSDSEYFKMLFLLLTATAQEERERLHKRQASGMKSKIIHRKSFNGVQPLGYVTETGTSRLVPATFENTSDLKKVEEMRVLQFIFIGYIMGLGQREIARTLNERNIKTRKKKEWSNKSVAHILQNVIYTGVLRGTLANEINYFIEDANVEPIIDPLLFDLVQQKLSISKPGRKSKVQANLPEYVVCDECFLPMGVELEQLVCNSCGMKLEIESLTNEVKSHIEELVRNNSSNFDIKGELKHKEQYLIIRNAELEKELLTLIERQKLIEKMFIGNNSAEKLLDINTQKQSEIKSQRYYVSKMLEYLKESNQDLGDLQMQSLNLIKLPFIVFASHDKIQFVFHENILNIGVDDKHGS